jgi:hypothetical protein
VLPHVAGVLERDVEIIGDSGVGEIYNRHGDRMCGKRSRREDGRWWEERRYGVIRREQFPPVSGLQEC